MEVWQSALSVAVLAQEQLLRLASLPHAFLRCFVATMAAQQQMTDFLNAVDTPVAPTWVPAIVSGLALGGFDWPSTLNKADPTEVIAAFPAEGESKLNPARKAFVRRAIEAATRAAAMVTAASTAVAPHSQQP